MFTKNRKELKKVVGCVCLAYISLLLQAQGMEYEEKVQTNQNEGSSFSKIFELECVGNRVGIRHDNKLDEESSDNDDAVEIYNAKDPWRPNN